MDISDEIITKRGSEVEALYNLSRTLNAGLNRRSLAILLELMEEGINPESLVDGK